MLDLGTMDEGVPEPCDWCAHLDHRPYHRRRVDALPRPNECASGFANRFLFAAVRRSKFLPHGGAVDNRALLPLSRPFYGFNRPDSLPVLAGGFNAKRIPEHHVRVGDRAIFAGPIRKPTSADIGWKVVPGRMHLRPARDALSRHPCTRSRPSIRSPSSE
jgi:hypothetical protein